jgi:hypothetical protein
MKFTNGEDRILYIKLLGVFLPLGCLTDNSFSETAEMIDTTTRENNGWTSSRPSNQSYSISFSGLQINTTLAGGNFNVISYDKLKELKRDRQLLAWKIQGTDYPVVDYGNCYITGVSEANTVGELITFSGELSGFGRPYMASLQLVLLNNGDPTKIVQDGNNNLIRV